MPVLTRLLLSAPLACCLLFTTYNGFVEGSNMTHYWDTPGMKVATAFQLAYGVLGAVGLFVLVRRPRWSSVVLLGWCLAVTAEGLLAPIVYAGQSIAYGVIAAVIVAAIAASAWWAWVRASRVSKPATKVST
jgi:hypothetical protein